MAANGAREEFVSVSIENGVARITIDRPSKRNALSRGVIAELMSRLHAAEADDGVRVVILTGAGDRAFAAGADLEELPDTFATPAAARDYDDHVTRLYHAMETSRLPIIARMAGSAIGGGCLLALACDVRIAASTVKVAFPVARIGLMLSAQEHRLLLRQLTPSQAKLLLFTGRALAAEEAASLNLVDIVTPPEELDATVGGLAQRIVAGAPLALGAAKRILSAIACDGAVEAAIAQGYQSVYGSIDLREGLLAAREKRSPCFMGR